MASIQDKPLALAGLALATGLAAYTVSKATQKPKYTLPPSPPSYPLIGNLFSIPQEFEYLGYMKIGEQLGSKIISLSALGTTMIILNDREDAENLFEKRSAIYSDRTVPPMVSEPSLLNWGHYLAIAGYGDRWKMYRRLINPWLSKRSSDGFQRSQTHETHLFLTRLLARGTGTITSEECESELYLTIAGTMLRAIYGYTVKSLDDPLMVGAQKAISNLTKAMMPSNFMVNVIPALVHVPDWFPGTGWKATARAWRKQKDDLLEESYRTAMANVERENHETIMAKTSKSEALRLGLTEEQADEYVREAALGLFGGGADTSVNTLLMFFIAMLLFPEVQKKAQEELDSVLGTNRLPTVEDQEKLPYIGRFIQETLRWAPAGPLALPHTCFQDDKYLGYDIPKGAILFGNVWAMTRDPKVYKDPETFDPDRFLDPSVPHPPTFGWGRRACPGIYFAETSLFLVIASALMTFNIRPAQDERGRDIKTTLRIANEITLRPEPFKFRLVPRSARHEQLIRTSV